MKNIFRGFSAKKFLMFCVLALAALALVSSAGQAKGKEEKAGPKATVTGKLVGQAGAAISKADLIILKGAKGLWIIKEGLVENPSAQTDKNGNFSVAIPLSFLGPDREFMVRISNSTGGVFVVDAKTKVPAVFKLDGKTTKLNLGAVTCR
jgi:hypothetical protein